MKCKSNTQSLKVFYNDHGEMSSFCVLPTEVVLQEIDKPIRGLRWNLILYTCVTCRILYHAKIYYV